MGEDRRDKLWVGDFPPAPKPRSSRAAGETVEVGGTEMSSGGVRFTWRSFGAFLLGLATLVSAAIGLAIAAGGLLTDFRQSQMDIRDIRNELREIRAIVTPPFVPRKDKETASP
jgi:hypothetical protein